MNLQNLYQRCTLMLALYHDLSITSMFSNISYQQIRWHLLMLLIVVLVIGQIVILKSQKCRQHRNRKIHMHFHLLSVWIWKSHKIVAHLFSVMCRTSVIALSVL